MADLSHYAREQFAHRETEILPTRLSIKGPLADLMTVLRQ
jgi:hypothetical protein